MALVTDNTVEGTLLVYTHDGSGAVDDEVVFTYTVEDDDNEVSNEATVTITVTAAPGDPSNTAPLAVNDSATVTAGQSVVIDVLANDSDADGNETIDINSIEFVSLPVHVAGTADSFEVRSDGQVFYRHNGTNIPQDEFTYRVMDTQGAVSNVATVSITVNPFSDNLPPFATSDRITIDQGETVMIDVLLNDTDPDGEIDRDSVTPVTLPTKGTLLLDIDGNVVIEDGVFTYAQDQAIDFNDNGLSFDQFDYNVADTEGGARNGRVFVTIVQNEIPVNSLAAFHRDGQTFLTWNLSLIHI